MTRRSHKQTLVDAVSLAGMERWQPQRDVPGLNRPRKRPEGLFGNGRIAAVMVLFYPVHEPADSSMPLSGLNLVLTQRQSTLSKHASQISLPGGRQDGGETLEQTAIRETHEEIGVPGRELEVLGQLNPVYIPPTDFTVTPFVALHPGAPRFVRSETEVKEIIETTVETLMNPSTLIRGEVDLPEGGSMAVPCYELGGHRVWGATAIILSELIERLRRVGV